MCLPDQCYDTHLCFDSKAANSTIVEPALGNAPSTHTAFQYHNAPAHVGYAVHRVRLNVCKDQGQHPLSQLTCHTLTASCTHTGYGFRAPNDCWTSAWMVVFQSVWGQLLDAVVLGVIFARISHPKQRARTIFM